MILLYIYPGFRWSIGLTVNYLLVILNRIINYDRVRQWKQ